MKYLTIVLMVFIANGAFAESTNKSKIKVMLYNGQADFVFFISEGGWEVKDVDGNILCTPYYVQVINSVAGRDKLFSMGLAAKASGAEIEFVGECSSEPNYFNAYYARLY